MPRLTFDYRENRCVYHAMHYYNIRQQKAGGYIHTARGGHYLNIKLYVPLLAEL